MTFPNLIHVAIDDSYEEHLCLYTDGVDSLNDGQRVALYKRIAEGTVRGPKTFVPNKTKRASS